MFTFFRLLDSVMFWLAAVARRKSFVKLVSVSLLFTVRTREERNTCCELIRPSSQPSPTPWRLRRKARASPHASV